MPHITLISNGFGEDQIAAKLTTAIKTKDTRTQFHAIPLIGKGHEYKKIGITPLIQNPALPSGGFIRNPLQFLRDVFAGSLIQHKKQRKLIKKSGLNSTITICVGDVFCLIMGALKNRSNIYFLPTAKSDKFMPHSWIEKWAIKKWAKLTFPRDEETANSLIKAGINAQFLGNPMMDGLEPTGDSFGLDTNRPIIGLIPGSKEEAYGNLKLILDVVAEHKTGQYLCAKAPSLDPLKIETLISKFDWKKVESKTLKFEHNSGAQVLFTEKFTDVLALSQVCIGLAGTANEQATHLGIPVICFPGTGPQTTVTRFKEQTKLCGPKLHFIQPYTIEIIVNKMNELIAKPINKNIPNSLAAHKIIQQIIS